MDDSSTSEQSDSESSANFSTSDSKDDNDEQYRSSDTSEDIPDPNLDEESLYQDEDCLPKGLRRSHFEEGLIYTMTLKSKRHNSELIWIVECKKETFLYQLFFNSNSKSKTQHESGKDVCCSYSDVQRLANRRELVNPLVPAKAFIELTLRFSYGISSSPITITVERFTARTIEGTIIC